MQLLAWPVRFVAGRAQTIDTDTDAGVAQQLALLCKVRRGERDLAPAFGIPDPTFRGGVDVVEINAALRLFGPDVQVDVARLVQRDSLSQVVELAWSDVAAAGAPVAESVSP